jgi:SAM-dependent methyltransferase
MSTSRRSDPTVDYYDLHAAAYAAGTKDVDMAPLYGPFLGLLPPGGHILDAGCGSGRDALAFKRRGYRVTAVDASAKMARLASAMVGQPVEVLRFQELSYPPTFDGVWACASLLHVPRAEIDEVLGGLGRALREGGAWYMSFKWGEREEVRRGRLFNDYTEASFGELLGRHPRLDPVRIWRAGDLRPERAGEVWLNVLVRKAARGTGAIPRAS